MSKKIYLTIDDSPTADTRELVDFLVSHNIQALMFCRGDAMENHMDAVIYAIQNGMVIGNHLYSHTRASKLGDFEKVKEEILKTEMLIDAAYERAGQKRPGKYVRFPYIDRGDGFDVERSFPGLIKAVWKGEPISLGQSKEVQKIQTFLQDQGFHQPFIDIHHPLYQIDDIRQAYDCLFTYSTCDWMLTKRHLEDKYEGDHPHKSIDDLKKAIDDDMFLQDPALSHIVLVHDQPELLDVVKALVSHFSNRGFTFKKFQPQNTCGHKTRSKPSL